MESFLNHLATYQVPHAYFTHFYIVSVMSSLFWGVQILVKGAAVRALASYSLSKSPDKSMTMEQVFLTWSLMALQGVRRLYESITLVKPSSSKMWFVHWFVGICFYLAVGVAVWIEGVGTSYQEILRSVTALPWKKPRRLQLVVHQARVKESLRHCKRLPDSLQVLGAVDKFMLILCTTGTVVSATPILDDRTLSPPSLRTLLCLPIFLVASGVQYDCHAYLASLKKYTLPAHPAFGKLVCPHYFAECLIYVALMFIAAPKGALINKTIFTALIFVSVNLGVTADMSREWYARKFGAEKVAGKWRMIPLIY